MPRPSWPRPVWSPAAARHPDRGSLYPRGYTAHHGRARRPHPAPGEVGISVSIFPQLVDVNPPIPAVGPSEAARLMDEGAVLIDVREHHEWEAGHVASARHIPLGDLSGRIDVLPRHTKVVVVCRSGGRSAAATAALIEAGFEAVNLSGGVAAWAASGRPLRSASGSTGGVI